MFDLAVPLSPQFHPYLPSRLQAHLGEDRPMLISDPALTKATVHIQTAETSFHIQVYTFETVLSNFTETDKTK